MVKFVFRRFMFPYFYISVWSFDLICRAYEGKNFRRKMW